MKYIENTGNDRKGVNIARRYHLSRLFAIGGLLLLLSSGFSSNANEMTFTFEYTYTIEANTCMLIAQGAENNSILNNPLETLNVDWSTVTKEQLTATDTTSKKTFGMTIDCDGDIYQPSLTVTGSNGDTTSTQGTLYVADTPDSVAGFAVRVSEASSATETTVIRDALTNQGQQKILSETEHLKKLVLEAWPTILPGKDVSDLKSGTDITGTVTIKVVYN